MKRKVLALATAVMVAASAVPVCSAASVTDFKDVPAESWYYESVKGAVDAGYMNGVSSDMFAPKNNLTRAMFVTMLARFDKAEVNDKAISPFEDVMTDMWYTGSVVWGTENNLIKGYSEKKFGTNDFIKREDIAVIVHRYIKLKNLTLKDKEAEQYKDVAQVSDYAKESVEFCRIHGLFLGDQHGNLYPQKLITRAEAAAVMERIALIIKEGSAGDAEKPVEDLPGGGGGAGGGGGGGGGGGTPVDPPKPPIDVYTYADYTVNVLIGKDSRSLDMSSVDSVDTGNVSYYYHVKYDKENKAVALESDNITLERIAEGSFYRNNLVKGLNIVKGQKFTDYMGNEQVVVSDSGNINEIVLKYVPLDEVLPSAAIDSIASQAGEILGHEVTTADVYALIDILDDDGIEKMTDLQEHDPEKWEMYKAIAVKLSDKLNSYVHEEGMDADESLVSALLERDDDKNGNIRKVMKEAGITEEDLQGMVKEYRENLENIVAQNQSLVRAAAYSQGKTVSTQGGIGVKVNPVKFAQIQWEKDTSYNKFVEIFFPETSLITGSKREALLNEAKSLYDLLEPEDWVENDGASNYSLFDEVKYESKCKGIISKIESIRSEFIKGKDTAAVAELLEKIKENLYGKLGEKLTVSCSDGNGINKLAGLLVLENPTMEDFIKAGITEISVEKDLTKDEALSYIDQFVSKVGLTDKEENSGKPMFDSVAEKAKGLYTLKIEIKKETCTKTERH